MKSTAYIDERGFFHSEIPPILLENARTYPPLPEPIREFLMQFQTACVVECCGIDAFEFLPPDASNPRWKTANGLEKLLEQEIEKAKEFPADVIKIWELNQLLRREDLVLLLKYLLAGRVQLDCRSGD